MELQLPPVLPLLHLWPDPIPRDGPENMAIDEWLAETCDAPVLRSYRWTPDWGSFGYFVKTADLPDTGLQWVRRWTGGGIVDHRADWTYTLFIPRGFGLAEAKGAESYRIIHAALAGALQESGLDARLSGVTPSVPGGECFIQPVEHDILDSEGRKIAGAGQRRTARGLLHQGSVAASRSVEDQLAAALSRQVLPRIFEPGPGWITGKAEARYAADAWTRRR